MTAAIKTKLEGTPERGLRSVSAIVLDEAPAERRERGLEITWKITPANMAKFPDGAAVEGDVFRGFRSLDAGVAEYPLPDGVEPEDVVDVKIHP